MRTKFLMERAVVWAAHAVMAIVALAAISKATAFREFLVSLSTWQVLPEQLLVIGGASVVGAEFLLAGLWFLGVSPARVAAATAAMLALYTGVYVWKVALGDPPDCNCLGRLLAFEAAQRSSGYLIGRNTLLTGILVARAVSGRRTKPRGEPAARPPSQALPRSAFTLMETLVTILVIALLIAIALPALAAVRARSRTVVSLSNLRQHASAFAAYAGDWKDTLPRFIEPNGDHRLAETAATGPFPYAFEDHYPYFIQSIFWPFVMARSGYESLPWNAELFYPPGADILAGAELERDMPYQYSATFVSAPAFWQQTTRTGPDQWVGVRFADVRYGSNKILISTVMRPDGRPAEAHLGYADGSADQRSPGDVEPAYPGGEGNFEGAWSPFTGWPLGSHTISGVHGRDVRSR